MHVLAIIGGSGFIGKHLLEILASRTDVRVKVLVRETSLGNGSANISFIQGDLLLAASLDELLEPGCTVINLAFLGASSRQENLEAISNLVDVCARKGVKRLIHCSTAVVVGRCDEKIIGEDTPCHPVSEYEKTKLMIERLILDKTRSHFDRVILRPTAVFGPGGKNLIKLANQISANHQLIGYLKDCLFNRRSMNLVCVENVVSALLFLVDSGKRFNQDIFIISDDDDPQNNYRDVERCLAEAMGKQLVSLPIISCPPAFLGWLLRISGKTLLNPSARFSARKLEAAGFRKTIKFETGLKNFGTWYQSRR